MKFTHVTDGFPMVMCGVMFILSVFCLIEIVRMYYETQLKTARRDWSELSSPVTGSCHVFFGEPLFLDKDQVIHFIMGTPFLHENFMKFSWKTRISLHFISPPRSGMGSSWNCVSSFFSAKGDTGDGGMEGKGKVYCGKKTGTIDAKSVLEI